jgi:hypothetical protein
MRKYVIPQPHRVRKIDRSFAWIDHRLLRSGYLQVMENPDQALYLFLALAADRHGVSFYRKEKICDILGLDWEQFEVARDRLINLRLIAFQPYSALSPNGHCQLLPVDGRPPDYAQQAFVQAQRRARDETVRHRNSRPPRRPDEIDPVAWVRS